MRGRKTEVKARNAAKGIVETTSSGPIADSRFKTEELSTSCY